MFISPDRIVVIPAEQPAYGVSPTRPVLFWPVAEPEDDLDYGLDVAAPIADAEDTIMMVAVSWAPHGAGELSIGSLQAVGNLIGMMAAGGIAGRPYVVRVRVVTAGGRTFTYRIGLRIDPDAGAAPPPKPANPGFGPEIEWTAAPPTPIPSLIFSDPRNFSAWPFGCVVRAQGRPLPPPPPVPALIFNVARNFSAWPFGCVVRAQGSPLPSDVVVPSLDFRSGLNIGLWFGPLGQVVEPGTTPKGPSPALIFSDPRNFSAWPFGCRVV